MPRRRRPDPPTAGRHPDPFAVLGLAADAGARDVLLARRRLAKRAHPDAGGSLEQMQLVNDAADAALRLLAAGAAGVTPAGAPPTGTTPATGRRRPEPRPSPGPVRRDHPSFTIEALPAEAFEALLIVASWLGDLVDDDPPYALELVLSEPLGGWCRLDLVPDAGAATVSIAVAAAPGHPVPSVDEVRDAFVAGLNQLDWDTLGG